MVCKDNMCCAMIQYFGYLLFLATSLCDALAMCSGISVSPSGLECTSPSVPLPRIHSLFLFLPLLGFFLLLYLWCVARYAPSSHDDQSSSVYQLQSSVEGAAAAAACDGCAGAPSASKDLPPLALGFPLPLPLPLPFPLPLAKSASSFPPFHLFFPFPFPLP